MLIYSLSSSKNVLDVRYIGYTKKSLNKRLIEHLSGSKNMKTYKDKWIQKCLSNHEEIIINLIEICKTHKELIQKEIYYINNYKNNGYKLTNLTDGGDGIIGYTHTEEFKKWNSDIKSKKVYCFNYQTKELYRIFKSVTDMVKSMKFTRSSVGDVLSGKSKHHKGFTFSYTNYFPEFKDGIRTSWNKGISTKALQSFNTKKVSVKTSESEQIFDSLTEATDYLKMNKKMIFRYLKSKKPYRGKYYFNYY